MTLMFLLILTDEAGHDDHVDDDETSATSDAMRCCTVVASSASDLKTTHAPTPRGENRWKQVLCTDTSRFNHIPQPSPGAGSPSTALLL